MKTLVTSLFLMFVLVNLKAQNEESRKFFAGGLAHFMHGWWSENDSEDTQRFTSFGSTINLSSISFGVEFQF